MGDRDNWDTEGGGKAKLLDSTEEHLLVAMENCKNDKFYVVILDPKPLR